MDNGYIGCCFTLLIIMEIRFLKKGTIVVNGDGIAFTVPVDGYYNIDKNCDIHPVED